MTSDLYEYNCIDFHALTDNDMPLLHRWLNLPHVSEWWYLDNGNRTPSLEEVQEQWSTPDNDVFFHIVLLNDEPFAYIQWYRGDASEESREMIRNSENTAGIDLFIGEPAYLYKGLGSLLIRKYLLEIVFKEPDIQSCIIDPEPENRAAIRAYEKAGFVYRYTKYNPGENVDAYIMRLEKNDLTPDE